MQQVKPAHLGSSSVMRYLIDAQGKTVIGVNDTQYLCEKF